MNELECRELVELVTDYLEGALDEPTQRRVLEHLAECEGCADYVDQMRDTVRALGEPVPDTLPDSTRQALLAAFRARPR
jgi:predicted anti-sigma-YlaC factor YlaD